MKLLRSIYATPPAAPAPAGAGGGGASSSRFQQSLDTERALDAHTAATFADNAPLDNPIDSGSAARRRAFVSRNRVKADLSADAAGAGPNYFQNREMASAWNDRENTANAAGVGLLNSQSGVNQATAADLGLRGRMLYPAAAKQMTSEAAVHDATAGDIRLMGPARRDALDATTAGASVDTGLRARFGAPLLQNQVDAGAIQNQGAAQANRFAPSMVPLTQDQLRANAERTRAEAGKISAEGQSLLQPQADPRGGVEALQKQYEFFKKNGMEAEAQAVRKQMLPPGVEGSGGAADAAPPSGDINLGIGPSKSMLNMFGIAGSGGPAPAPAPAPTTPQGGGNLPRPRTPAEAQQLPRGTRFIDPNGQIRIR